jgi:hypothetical protein
MDHADLLSRTTDLALQFLNGLPERRVGQAAAVVASAAAILRSFRAAC